MPDERSLTQVVRQVVAERGGRITRDELVAAVREAMTADEYERWSSAAFRRAVLSASKSSTRSSGTSAVYATGKEVSALRHFTYEEFLTKAVECAWTATGQEAVVYQLAEACYRIHGRSFDPGEVMDDARKKRIA